MKFTTASPEETIELGKKIGLRLQRGDVIAMQGTNYNNKGNCTFFRR